MTAPKDALRRFAGYFSRNEKLLWGLSVGFIIVSFCIFDRESYMDPLRFPDRGSHP